MSKRLLSHDPLTGLFTYHDYDPQTDETFISYESDAEPILEINKAMQNDPEVWKDGVKNSFALYASVPVGLQMKWLVEEGIDVWKKEDWDRVAKKLIDPEYKYIKATTKKHL